MRTIEDVLNRLRSEFYGSNPNRCNVCVASSGRSANWCSIR